jgi:hypothetical protein
LDFAGIHRILKKVLDGFKDIGRSEVANPVNQLIQKYHPPYRWTSAETPDFNFSAFTELIVDNLFSPSYKFLFQIGKKPLIFVDIVYSENKLLRTLPIVSITFFASICNINMQSVQLPNSKSYEKTRA